MSSGDSHTAPPITEMLLAAERGDSSARQQLWELIYNELRRLAHAQLKNHDRRPELQTTTLVHEAYLRLVGPDGDALHWESRRHFFAAAAKSMRRICVDDARRYARLKRGGPGLEGASGVAGVDGGPEGRSGECADRSQSETGEVTRRADRLAGHSPRSASAGDNAGGNPGDPAGRDGQLGGWKRIDLRLENVGAWDRDAVQILALDEALTKLEKLDPQKAEVIMLRFFAGLTVDQTAATMGIAPRTVDILWRVARAWLHRELSDRD